MEVTGGFEIVFHCNQINGMKSKENCKIQWIKDLSLGVNGVLYLDFVEH